MDNNEPDEIREQEKSAETDNEQEQNQTPETLSENRPINLNLPVPPPDCTIHPSLSQAIQQSVSAIKGLAKLFNPETARQIAATARASALRLDYYSRRILEIYSSSWYQNLSKQIERIKNGISVLIQSVDYTGISASTRNYIKRVEAVIDAILFESKWIPSVRTHLDWEERGGLFEILSSTRNGSANRTKKVDSFIFNHFDTKHLSEMKKKWRQSGLPNYIYRILSQSVDAYNKRQYALTLSSMAMLWEKLIALLSDESKYRTITTTKKEVSELIETATNEANSLITQYFNDYIYYNCTDESDVIENVPGRHGIVHGWYSKYPTRKAALNAILFTDMLIDFGSRVRSALDNSNDNEQGDIHAN